MKKLLWLLLIVSFSAQSQSLYRMVNGIPVKMNPSDSAAFVQEGKKDDSIRLANLGFDTTLAKISIREAKIKVLRAYLRSQVNNNTTYENIVNNLATFNLIEAYLNGSDRIISWIKGENSATYGNFTLTGFPSRTYYTVARQTALLNILQ